MDWKSDKAFVDWLLSTGYVIDSEKGIKPLTLGVILYMFDAYGEGFNVGFQGGREAAELDFVGSVSSRLCKEDMLALAEDIAERVKFFLGDG